MNTEPRCHEFQRFGKGLIAYKIMLIARLLDIQEKKKIFDDYIHFGDFGHRWPNNGYSLCVYVSSESNYINRLRYALHIINYVFAENVQIDFQHVCHIW